jgi:hypothetical protein
MTYKPLSYLVTWLLVGASNLPAQAHGTHRHPAGAKIIMQGTLVEAVCHFAERQRGSALTQCAQSRSKQDFHAALLTSDSTLYLLAASAASPVAVTTLLPLVGRAVKVDGTVFPAASGYVLVLDSVRTAGP